MNEHDKKLHATLREGINMANALDEGISLAATGTEITSDKAHKLNYVYQAWRARTLELFDDDTKERFIKIYYVPDDHPKIRHVLDEKHQDNYCPTVCLTCLHEQIHILIEALSYAILKNTMEERPL